MSSSLRNIKLVVSFDGTGFSGWQRQKYDCTIQGEIESCLTRMTREEINLHGAGRTDSGVHARGMVAHFATKSVIPSHDFLRGLNSMLPGDIRICSAEDVDPEFHSRYSAIGKMYRYIIYTGKIHPPHQRLYSLHVTSTLNLEVIRECLKMIEGSHDFASFENSGSRDKNKSSGRGAIRIIVKAELCLGDREQLVFEFTGDGFLRSMVRNLVGSLLEAGRGKLTVEDFAKILEAKDRTMAGPTAPAHGLFLIKVLY